jgi:class 3 adenylate cyclase
MKYEMGKINDHDSLNESVNLTPKMSTSDYLVSFSGNIQSYCIGMVDMVNSTKITHQMSNEKRIQYYEIFLNSMGKIVNRFGGIVIKNIGDSLLYYFPESSKHKRKYGFMSCLEANLAMIEQHKTISNHLLEKALPVLDYRISSDYGPCAPMRHSGSTSPDLIGPPVNMCSKINRSAAVNGIIIGSDLYEVVKDIDEYEFKKAGDYSIGLKHSYPLYRVTRKN